MEASTTMVMTGGKLLNSNSTEETRANRDAASKFIVVGGSEVDRLGMKTYLEEDLELSAVSSPQFLDSSLQCVQSTQSVQSVQPNHSVTEAPIQDNGLSISHSSPGGVALQFDFGKKRHSRKKWEKFGGNAFPYKFPVDIALSSNPKLHSENVGFSHALSDRGEHSKQGGSSENEGYVSDCSVQEPVRKSLELVQVVHEPVRELSSPQVVGTESADWRKSTKESRFEYFVNSPRKSLDEIEAKLSAASARRQKFLEWISQRAAKSSFKKDDTCRNAAGTRGRGRGREVRRRNGENEREEESGREPGGRGRGQSGRGRRARMSLLFSSPDSPAPYNPGPNYSGSSCSGSESTDAKYPGPTYPGPSCPDLSEREKKEEALSMERYEDRWLQARRKRLERQREDQKRRREKEASRKEAKEEVETREKSRAEMLSALLENKVEKAEMNRLARREEERRRRDRERRRMAAFCANRERIERSKDERAARLSLLLRKRLENASSKRSALILDQKRRVSMSIRTVRSIVLSLQERRERERREKGEGLERRVRGARERREREMRGRARGENRSSRGRERRKRMEALSRDLARRWKSFKKERKTTVELTENFLGCGLTLSAVANEDFFKLAGVMENVRTLKATRSLLTRFDTKLRIKCAEGAENSSSGKRTKEVYSLPDIDYLLKKISPTNRKAAVRRTRPTVSPASRGASSSSTATSGSESDGRGCEDALKPQTNEQGNLDRRGFPDDTPHVNPTLNLDGKPNGKPKGNPDVNSNVKPDAKSDASARVKLGANARVSPVRERYPTRIFLCAFMTSLHPDSVFSRVEGERERGLQAAAKVLVEAFEKLVAKVADGAAGKGGALEKGRGCQGSRELNLAGGDCETPSFFDALVEFDRCWVKYADKFVAWKINDVLSLENEIIGAACKLEREIGSNVQIREMERKGTREDEREREGERAEEGKREKRGEITETGRKAWKEALQEQVYWEQLFLRERVVRLSGAEGGKRFDERLIEERAREKERKKERTGDRANGLAAEKERERREREREKEISEPAYQRAASDEKRHSDDKQGNKNDANKNGTKDTDNNDSNNNNNNNNSNNNSNNNNNTGDSSGQSSNNDAGGSSNSAYRFSRFRSDSSGGNNRDKEDSEEEEARRRRILDPSESLPGRPSKPKDPGFTALKMDSLPSPFPSSKELKSQKIIPLDLVTNEELLSVLLLADEEEEAGEMSENSVGGSKEEDFLCMSDDSMSLKMPAQEIFMWRLQNEIRQSMEKAFWDLVREELSLFPPSSNRLLAVLREVEREMGGVAPAKVFMEMKEEMQSMISVVSSSLTALKEEWRSARVNYSLENLLSSPLFSHSPYVSPSSSAPSPSPATTPPPLLSSSPLFPSLSLTNEVKIFETFFSFLKYLKLFCSPARDREIERKKLEVLKCLENIPTLELAVELESLESSEEFENERGWPRDGSRREGKRREGGEGGRGGVRGLKELVGREEPIRDRQMAVANCIVMSLQFLFSEIQILKKEVSRFRVHSLLSLIPLHSIFSYLENKFLERYFLLPSSSSSFSSALEAHLQTSRSHSNLAALISEVDSEPVEPVQTGSPVPLSVPNQAKIWNRTGAPDPKSVPNITEDQGSSSVRNLEETIRSKVDERRPHDLGVYFADEMERVEERIEAEKEREGEKSREEDRESERGGGRIQEKAREESPLITGRIQLSRGNSILSRTVSHLSDTSDLDSRTDGRFGKPGLVSPLPGEGPGEGKRTPLSTTARLFPSSRSLGGGIGRSGASPSSSLPPLISSPRRGGKEREGERGGGLLGRKNRSRETLLGGTSEVSESGELKRLGENSEKSLSKNSLPPAFEKLSLLPSSLPSAQSTHSPTPLTAREGKEGGVGERSFSQAYSSSSDRGRVAGVAGRQPQDGRGGRNKEAEGERGGERGGSPLSRKLPLFPTSCSVPSPSSPASPLPCKFSQMKRESRSDKHSNFDFLSLFLTKERVGKTLPVTVEWFGAVEKEEVPYFRAVLEKEIAERRLVVRNDSDVSTSQEMPGGVVPLMRAGRTLLSPVADKKGKELIYAKVGDEFNLLLSDWTADTLPAKDISPDWPTSAFSRISLGLVRLLCLPPVDGGGASGRGEKPGGERERQRQGKREQGGAEGGGRGDEGEGRKETETVPEAPLSKPESNSEFSKPTFSKPFFWKSESVNNTVDTRRERVGAGDILTSSFRTENVRYSESYVVEAREADRELKEERGFDLRSSSRTLSSSLPEVLLSFEMQLEKSRTTMRSLVACSVSLLIARQVAPALFSSLTSSQVRQLWKLCSLLHPSSPSGLASALVSLFQDWSVAPSAPSASATPAMSVGNLSLLKSMLTKSLSPTNAVFVRVTKGVQSALVSLLLYGRGPVGLELARAFLTKVGAVRLEEQTVRLAKALWKVSKLSARIHKSVYKSLLK